MRSPSSFGPSLSIPFSSFCSTLHVSNSLINLRDALLDVPEAVEPVVDMMWFIKKKEADVGSKFVLESKWPIEWRLLNLGIRLMSVLDDRTSKE